MLKLADRAINFVRRNLEDTPYVRNLSAHRYRTLTLEHQPNLPYLEPWQQKIVNQIKQNGVAITSLDRLYFPLNEKMKLEAMELLPGLSKRQLSQPNKYVVTASPHEIFNLPNIYTWGLQPQILDLVENYLGLPVAYHGAYVRRDLANHVIQKSRLWHFDMEDYKSLKIILYINDVTIENGPLQYISRKYLIPYKALSQLKFGYHSDQKLKALLPNPQISSCLGPSGTLILIDTANILHKGQVPVKGDRFSLFFDYTSRFPRRPYYCKSSLPTPYLKKVAETLDARAKACVYWREKP